MPLHLSANEHLLHGKHLESDFSDQALISLCIALYFTVSLTLLAADCLQLNSYRNYNNTPIPLTSDFTFGHRSTRKFSCTELIPLFLSGARSMKTTNCNNTSAIFACRILLKVPTACRSCPLYINCSPAFKTPPDWSEGLSDSVRH
jgi:hypothetical protein